MITWPQVIAVVVDVHVPASWDDTWTNAAAGIVVPLDAAGKVNERREVAVHRVLASIIEDVQRLGAFRIERRPGAFTLHGVVAGEAFKREVKDGGWLGRAHALLRPATACGGRGRAGWVDWPGIEHGVWALAHPDAARPSFTLRSGSDCRRLLTEHDLQRFGELAAARLHVA